MKHTIFSGIQPSGQLHIGNYFGAIQSWLDLQNDSSNDCIFAVVDYHALTEGPKPAELKQRIFEAAVDFLSAGVNPKKSTIMIQSLVPEHTDLQWILNCVTPVSWLERVPTFKEKAAQFRQNVNMGLFDYPVLMAADILLYKADLVPVGQDQFAHLELAREIARAFNNRYGQTFPEPQEKITLTPKLMALSDPTKKMSKSLGPKSYISLSDSEATIKQKIKSMVTTTGDEKDVIKEFLQHTKEIHQEFHETADKTARHAEIKAERDLSALEKELGRPKFEKFMALYNFYMLLYLFAKNNDRRRFLDELKDGTIKFSTYKELLAERIITYPALKSFREKRKKLINDPEQVWHILRDGSQKARARAQKNLTEIKEKIGLA